MYAELDWSRVSSCPNQTRSIQVAGEVVQLPQPEACPFGQFRQLAGAGYLPISHLGFLSPSQGQQRVRRTQQCAVPQLAVTEFVG